MKFNRVRRLRRAYKKRSILTFFICLLVAILATSFIQHYLNDFLSTDTVSVSSADIETATVKRVVDGDTIVIEGDEYVRLIGVDTPESVHPDESKNTDEGELASEFLTELLPVGTTIYLEYDKDLTDSYGRTLAYVWLVEPNTDDVSADYVRENMVQGILLEANMAQTLEVEPNTRYALIFAQLAK